MRALSGRNDDPQAASRPWDRDRDGFVLSDGAGILVLEEYEHAKARGARIYAELTGFGMSDDAFHMTAPPEDGSGAALSMRNAIRDAGIDFELKIPHRAFNRKVGGFAGIRSTPEGRIITEGQWDERHADWLPSAEDQAYVQSLMVPVTEPGKMANWIAAPAKGIDGQPIDFEYLRFN